MHALCLALLLPFASISHLRAQGTTGSIVGVVTDATGAAVPAATVTIKNTSTGIARTLKTDGQGRYTATALGNGAYTITATATGFKTTALNGVNLDINQTLSENVSLAAGGASEEISVEAQAITTDTETSSNGQVLGAEAVSDLPLANRQFYNLVEVAPGVAPPATNSSMSFRGGMNVNGAAETANLFMLNGTFNIDISTNQPTFRPSVDTIAEFKVITGVPSADYGRMNGGQIVIVTKQGSNKFHGSLYEYIRNGAIEAKPWSPSVSTLTPAFKQNTFGGTVGGPILKDKAFFFFGYEGQRIRQQITATSTVPTVWQQSGCLSTNATLYNPATGKPLTPYTATNPATSGPCSPTYTSSVFGANAGSPDGTGYDITATGINALTDPTTGWNSPSATLGRLMTQLAYPAPNTNIPIHNNATPANDYLFNETRAETMDEFNTRFDYKQSEKDSWNASFNHFHDPSFEPNNSLCSSRTLPNFGCYTDQISWLFNVGENHIITPNLLNSAVVGWNRLQQPRVQQDFTSIGTAWPGLPGQFINPPSNNLGLPSITESGSSYTTTGGQTNLPQNRWDNAFDFDESITWTHKAHTIKAGAQILVIKLTEFEISQGRGNLTFSPSSITGNNGTTNQGTTGDYIGDTLLGLPYQASDTNTVNTVYNRYNSYDFFVMDDWKLKSNLTLNLGVRYELDMPESEKNGNYSTFAPSTANPLSTGAGVYNPNGVYVGGLHTLYSTDKNNFAPRLGFAYQPFHNEKTVVKGAYGIFYTEPEAFNEFLSYAIQYPTRYPKTFTTQAYAAGGAITLSNPFPNELPTPGTPYCTTPGTGGCNAPVVGTGCASPCGLLPVITGTETNPHYSTPYVSQWTLGIQRQITKSILAEAVYFGNKGTKIAFGCTAQINTNPNNDADQLGTNYLAGTTKVTLTNGGAATVLPTVTAIGAAQAQSERRFPSWNAIGYHTTGCNSEYESLQSRMQINTKGGLSVLVSYTYGRAEDGLSAAENPTPTHLFDKELANFDIRHRLVISPVVPLPFGKGQPFLNSGLGSALLGGFKVSGIYQYFTGRPVNIANSSTSLLSSSVALSTGVGDGNDRPDLLPGTSLTGHDATNNSSVHNHNEWFNVHSLAYAPPGQYGNLAPNTVEGPGWDELDLTLGRTFPIREWAKAEFKVDAFNLLNHPNLYNPTNSTYGGTSVILSENYPTNPGYCEAGHVTPTGTTAVLPGTSIPCTAGGGVNGAGSFGTITQANNMREIQASVHITF